MDSKTGETVHFGEKDGAKAEVVETPWTLELVVDGYDFGAQFTEEEMKIALKLMGKK